METNILTFWKGQFEFEFWCLTPLSAIFQLYHATSFSGGGSRSISHRNICFGRTEEVTFICSFSEWVSDWLSMRWWWWWSPICSRITCLVKFFIVLVHWNYSPRIDMSPPLGHIILIPSQSVFVFSSQCCTLSGEATNTNRSSILRSTPLETAQTYDLHH